MVNRDSIVRITSVLDALNIAHSSWYHKSVPSSERKRPGLQPRRQMDSLQLEDRRHTQHLHDRCREYLTVPVERKKRVGIILNIGFAYLQKNYMIDTFFHPDT